MTGSENFQNVGLVGGSWYAVVRNYPKWSKEGLWTGELVTGSIMGAKAHWCTWRVARLVRSQRRCSARKPWVLAFRWMYTYLWKQNKYPPSQEAFAFASKFCRSDRGSVGCAGKTSRWRPDHTTYRTWQRSEVLWGPCGSEVFWARGEGPTLATVLK